NNSREFFAMAMQAYLQPHTADARRLFSAHRELWALADEVMRTYAAFPGDVALAPQPAIGQDAIASPYSLAGLADDPSAAQELRALAAATLSHLEGLYTLAGVPQVTALPPPPPGSYARAARLVRLAR